MLMSAHNGAVDHRIFIVGVGRQVSKNVLPNSGFGPAAMAAVDVLPITKPLGQVTPGNARPVAIEHRLDEQPVVSRRDPDVALTPRQ